MSNDLPTMLRVRCTAGRSDERELVCRAADEIERLELELGKTHGEVIQRQDDLGRLLHAAETKCELQAKHIKELQAKMTCMCGDPVDHSPWSGHSPVSMFDYAVEQEVERRLATHTSGDRE